MVVTLAAVVVAVVGLVIAAIVVTVYSSDCAAEAREQ